MIAKIKTQIQFLPQITHLDCFKIPLQAILRGFAEVCETTGLMGRWQYIQKNPQLFVIQVIIWEDGNTWEND